VNFELSPNAYLEASWQRYKGKTGKASTAGLPTEHVINEKVSDRHLATPTHTKTSSASYWLSSDHQRRITQLNSLELAANAPKNSMVQVKAHTYVSPDPGSTSPGYFSLTDYVGRGEAKDLVANNLAGQTVARRAEPFDYAKLFLSYGLLRSSKPMSQAGFGRSMQAGTTYLGGDGGRFYQQQASSSSETNRSGTGSSLIDVDEQFSRLQSMDSSRTQSMLNKAYGQTRYSGYGF
jgi:hypothetical protein